MRLTKYEHSCVLVEDGPARVLIDPGSFSQGFDQLTGLTAVLITHQHPDHLDVDRLRPLLERNDGAELYTDAGTAAILAEAGVAATAVRPGDTVERGTRITAHGGHHAVIHPDVPVVPNVGFHIGGRFFHPGDSFTIPDLDVDVLGLPTGAPWLKASEAVDYVRAVTPHVAVPIHEAVLANPTMHYNLFDRLAPEETRVTVLSPGESIEL
ncbi:L-ascorbate metabolism protein UlaG (beta-lactamase superfamily) [Haloactinopolyspora alba]|uniref:L-ascorbate metabolism protein UlaG (Beta-lactamase superfamily) n=1 Tax=Haloactinopolyspora alba TaxID=648780 RepID=A0A2P8EFG6_9ACTN|nr:MBL fold metallo-hydrolase [Haloactinopolyspora alba]PSL08208.1 L-ascorbate metabolism protein UlaG (beta-lactamase superfamily) [Haloactinopolyspora alba]